MWKVSITSQREFQLIFYADFVAKKHVLWRVKHELPSKTKGVLTYASALPYPLARDEISLTRFARKSLFGSTFPSEVCIKPTLITTPQFALAPYFMSTRPPTEVSPLVHKERSPPPTQQKMTFKFTLVALAFQLVLLILFGTITNYGKFSSPPRKNDTLKAENEIRLYYPSKWFVLDKLKFLFCSL